MKRKQPGRKGFDLDYESIAQEYLSGEELKYLASKYNVSHWALLARFKKLGVRKTTKRTLNKRAFSNFTPESCYWGGFLAADGWVSKNGYFLGCELSIIDKGHLEKLCNFLKSSAKINKREKKSFGNKKREYCSVQFNSVSLVKDLRTNFNITNNKSLSYSPPEIPDSLIKHFIRGYVDGDGSVGWHKHNNKPRLNICSGSKKLLKWVFKQIKRNVGGIGHPSIGKKDSDSNTYLIEFMGQQSKDILNWLYEGSTIYLNRKFERFTEYVKRLKEQEIKSNKRLMEKESVIYTIKKLYEKNKTYEEISVIMKLPITTINYYMEGIRVARLDPKTRKLYQDIVESRKRGEHIKSVINRMNISESTYYRALRIGV